VKLTGSLKLLTITLILSGVLTGCSTNSTQPNYKLDFYSLSHSAVFTQRETINALLEEAAGKPNTETKTLLNNYCDLVERHIVYVSEENIPQQCSNRVVTHQSRSCAMQFHECASICSLRSNDCQPCVTEAKKCLEQ
jgi:hypothetical protein